MGKKILVVDDEQDVLKIILLRLEKAGYDVTGCGNGRDAIDIMHKILPDLALLDVYLPDINGDDVARLMKKDGKLKHIPVILISATAASIDERAKNCGAVNYLGKPFESEELLGMVEKALK